MKPLILVTGATGKTGFVTAKALLEKGYPVRALVRGASEKADGLKSLGAEIAVGNFHDTESLENAMEGVERAYLLYPPEDRLLEGTANFIVAATGKGVKAVVNMSQMQAYKPHRSPLTQQHWLAEQMLNLTDMTVVHLCPPFFAEMLYLMNAGNILQEGKMYLPHGDARHAPITADDIGLYAASILENPEKFKGQRLLLTGPELLTQAEIAAITSEVLSVPIEYVSVTREQWAEGVRQAGLRDEFLISHLSEVGDDFRINDVFAELTTTFEEVTGQKPTDMRAFVENSKWAFTPEFVQAMKEQMAGS